MKETSILDIITVFVQYIIIIIIIFLNFCWQLILIMKLLYLFTKNSLVWHKATLELYEDRTWYEMISKMSSLYSRRPNEVICDDDTNINSSPHWVTKWFRGVFFRCNLKQLTIWRQWGKGFICFFVFFANNGANNWRKIKLRIDRHDC